MSSIFQAKRGTIVSVPVDGGVAMGFIMLSGFDSNLFSSLLMITEVRTNRSQVVQYLKTLDTSNFGYAWGEGPGQIMVSGLIFFVDPSCQITGEGVANINQYYDENNVYSSDGQEKILVIGNASFRGYLEKLQITAEQNEFNYGSFSLEFTTLPK